jgi:hypothetical protein
LRSSLKDENVEKLLFFTITFKFTISITYYKV